MIAPCYQLLVSHGWPACIEGGNNGGSKLVLGCNRCVSRQPLSPWIYSSLKLLSFSGPCKDGMPCRSPMSSAETSVPAGSVPSACRATLILSSMQPLVAAVMHARVEETGHKPPFRLLPYRRAVTHTKSQRGTYICKSTHVNSHSHSSCECCNWTASMVQTADLRQLKQGVGGAHGQ